MPKKRKKKKKKKKQQPAGSTWSAGQPGALGWPTEGGGAPSAPGLRPGAPPRPYAPPPTLAPITPAYLLEAGDPHFDECLKQCYRGFVHQPRGVPAPMEARLLGALEALKRRGYFHYDVVRGMGSWVRTFVRRILVGVPGMTYSYLGLRIFAHPWDRGAGGTPEMEEIARTNAAVTEATQRLLYEGRGVGRGGRCDYNVTLINLMEDEDQRGGALRNKSGNNLGNAQVAVSWHADSSLEDFSSIAVLNLHATENAGAAEQAVDRVAAVAAATAQPFRIALRCIGEGHDKKRGGGTRGTPAVAVALASGDAYYMLNDFNHHHHHAVLAGSRGGGGGGGRYSSTHRVAVTAADTYSAISRRAAAALERAAPVFASHHHHVKNLHGVIEALRESEEVHSELEFEWLRQWGVQGRAHAHQHAAYWAPRMNVLRATWTDLEGRTAAHCRFVVDAVAAVAAAGGAGASTGAAGAGTLRQCCSVLLQALLLRRGGGASAKAGETGDSESTKAAAAAEAGAWGGGRAGWATRVQHTAYKQVPVPCQPFDFVEPDEEIDDQIAAVQRVMAQLTASAGGAGASGTRSRQIQHAESPSGGDGESEAALEGVGSGLLAANPTHQPQLPSLDACSHSEVWDCAFVLPPAELASLHSRSEVALEAAGRSSAASSGPAREVSRSARLRRLQQLFAKLCRAAARTAMPPEEAFSTAPSATATAAAQPPIPTPGLFEQWHFTWLFTSTLAGRQPGDDPLLPRLEPAGRVHNMMASQLREALHRWLPPESASEIVGRLMEVAVTEAMAAAAEMRADFDAGDGVTVQTIRGGGGGGGGGGALLLEVRWGGTGLRLSLGHYGKLLHMWQRRLRRAHSVAEWSQEEQRQFTADLFCLLLRYRTIRCSQFHAALPGPVFDWLRDVRGVQLEGMASPLNARFGSFCSAFADTDGPFGSLGSFFGFRPSEGSFEVNPPFVEAMYVAVAEHCAKLLAVADERGAALTFTIVVGATKITQQGRAWEILRSSRYSQGAMVVGAKEHKYCDGAQHTKTGCATAPPLVSVCATGVFFWASKTAAARWPIDTAKMDALHAAFRSASRSTEQSRGASSSSSGQHQHQHQHQRGQRQGGYKNKRKADRLRQRKDRQRQKARRKNKQAQ